jgi:phage shock protein PspC (stress-responsive transcriptional regulator)
VPDAVRDFSESHFYDYTTLREDGSMTQQNWLHSLARSETDRVIGGVCGGLGEHTPVPSWCWRLLFVLMLICFGTGFLIYILLWIFVPRKAGLVNSTSAHT